MKYLSLETYTDFVCTGSECPLTCCGGGWDIIIDEATDRYYRSVPGEMGKRLDNSINRENGKSSFILNEHNNCPFLNDRGLCDIYINLGEEHLSNTCTYYPRYMFYAGDICFAGVSISCPEVSRFYMTHEDPLMIDFADDGEPVSPDIEKNTDWPLFNQSIRALTCCVAIAQNRELAIKERLATILLYVSCFQDDIENDKNPQELSELFSSPAEYIALLPQTGIYNRDYESKTAFSSEMLSFLGSIGEFKRRLPEVYDLVEYFSEGVNSEICPDRWDEAFEWVDSQQNGIWQENILVYMIYKFFMPGFSKKDFYNRLLTGIEYVFISILFISALYYIQHSEGPSMDHLIMLTSSMSRLIEHNSSFRCMTEDHFRNAQMNDLVFILKLIS